MFQIVKAVQIIKRRKLVLIIETRNHIVVGLLHNT